VNQDNAPIIIKKGKKKGNGHHGGAWKVAYADFVTAMMALFIVLWILSQSEEVKKNVAEYFRNPSGFSVISTGDGQSLLNQGAGIDNTIIAGIKQKELEMQMLTELADSIKETLAEYEEFNQFSSSIDIQITTEGLRMEILETRNDLFFDLGTANLKPEAKKLIMSIGKELNKLDNFIVVEGHTDSRPFVSRGSDYSNFELSADRANSARRALIEGGLNERKLLEIRGLADRKLRNPKDPYDSSNRRVTILVKFSYN
jgi:chemotaxis protein MotB